MQRSGLKSGTRYEWTYIYTHTYIYIYIYIYLHIYRKRERDRQTVRQSSTDRFVQSSSLFSPPRCSPIPMNKSMFTYIYSNQPKGTALTCIQIDSFNCFHTPKISQHTSTNTQTTHTHANTSTVKDALIKASKHWSTNTTFSPVPLISDIFPSDEKRFSESCRPYPAANNPKWRSISLKGHLSPL